MASSMTVAPTRIIDSRHPSFIANAQDWEMFRITFRGGSEFREKYLEQMTTREDPNDFQIRKRITPIPTFAKAAISDIRNSIFQRMRDITRLGGSLAYQRAVQGEQMGVDNRGSSMNYFLGKVVLEELLVMGRVGVYVDNSVLVGNSVADAKDAKPYLYAYQVEDILSWSSTSPDSPSSYKSVLLRDTGMSYDQRTGLPMLEVERYRLMWIDENTGKVNLQFYDLDSTPIDRHGTPSAEPTQLDLDRIPFIMLDIGDSIIKDAASYQISLLNLVSRDVWYALQANFPFLVEQRDLRAGGGHLKNAANSDGTATTGGQTAEDRNIEVGAMHGRAYDKSANAPAFINPSPEPLMASIKLQEKMECDIRRLVNLSVQAAGGRASAESKELDNAGLEAGLSYIGLVLESAERQIAQYWSAYENRSVKSREIATIKYPDRYSLKTDADRITEATNLAKLMFSLPGRKVKREFAKLIVQVLLGGKVDVGTIDDIASEIESVAYLTSDPNVIIQAVEAGLCSIETGSVALGFDDDEAGKATADYAKRAALVLQAQSAGQPGPSIVDGSKAATRSIEPPRNPAARGVPGIATAPGGGKLEKKAANTNDLRIDKNRQRGKGKKPAAAAQEE